MNKKGEKDEKDEVKLKCVRGMDGRMNERMNQ